LYQAGAEDQRTGRATGGRAHRDPGKAAEALIKRAESALKNQGKMTKPLLGLPDEAITRALRVANRSI
jgi:hypothetical protein